MFSFRFYSFTFRYSCRSFLKYVIGGLATFVIAVVMPKPAIFVIREWLVYAIRSAARNWFLTFFFTLLPFIWKIFYNDGRFTSTFWIVYGAGILIIVTTIALFRTLNEKVNPLSIAVYGVFSVKDDAYLSIDLDADFLNQKIKNTLSEITAQFYTYKQDFITVRFIELPRFLPTIFGIKGIETFIKRRNTKHHHVAAIYFIRNISSHKLSASVRCMETGMVQTEMVAKVDALLNRF